MRFFIAIVALLYCVGISSAQMIVTHDSYKTVITAGYNEYIYYEADGEPFDLGVVGSWDNVYDLTKYGRVTLPLQVTYSDPSATPYASKYPSATHATYDDDLDRYEYYNFKQEGLYRIGVVRTISTGIEHEPDIPAMPIILFPLTVGSNWAYDAKPFLLEPSWPLFSKNVVRDSVIAGGTLITPVQTEPCHVLKHRYIKEMIAPTFSTATTFVTYYFITEHGLAARLMVDSVDNDNHTPVIKYLSYSNFATTGVHGENTVSSFSLHEVFPNPVHSGNPTMTWTSARSTFVSVVLYDIRGTNIATVFAGHCGPGTHSAPVVMQDLPQGMYFLRMITPDGMQTKKVLRY